MQTIEAAAQRMRQTRAPEAAPPPPPAYSPKLRAAPAVLEIKTRVLGELVEPAPAVASSVAAASPVRRVPWRWMAASVGFGMALGALVQVLWHGANPPSPPVAAAPRVGVSADPAVPASTPAPVAAAAAIAPVAALPAPASAAPAPDATAEVRERVTHWVAAWSARDVDRYLAFYAKDFAPGGGLTRAAWEAQRRARLSGASSIQVAVRDVRIEPEGADRAVVRFAQDYAAGSYRETGTRKRLVMRRDDGRWRIVSEGADA